MSTKSRQTVLAISLIGLLVESIVSHPALATDKVLLYKVVTPQDEIIIGLTKDELAELPGKDAGSLAKALHDKGSLDVWQYGARRVDSGVIEQFPRKKISVSDATTVRIERYETKSRIVAITDETMNDVVHKGTRL